MSYPFNLLKNAVIIFIKGQPHTVDSSHPNYGYVLDAIKKKEWDGIEELVSIPKAIVKASQGLVAVLDGVVTYKGRPVKSHLASRIIELLGQGFDISPWTKFMDKLHSNPDSYSVEQLYPFLERAKLPITPDGDFLAYKYVNSDYLDCHTHTMDNSPGKVVELPREQCDNNPNNHCSAGLHFCAKEYLPHTGSGVVHGQRIVIVKVNPRDVVSVPNDHNFQKARACRYVVVGELGEDYSIADMEAKAVLPPPRDLRQINTLKGVKMGVRALEGKIVGYINRHRQECVDCDITVRQVAKAVKITNAEVVANAGNKFFIYKAKGKAPALSDQRVGVKKAFKKEGL